VSFLLHIETATTVCSVAVSEGESVLATREFDEGYTHAENLHVFVRQTLEQLNLEPRNLDAVCVSRGPGSYTGLRIGSAAAKGLCFSLGIPLISVDTLRLMAGMAASLAEADLYVPMIDARRMEVYTASFNRDLSMYSETEALIVTEESLTRYAGHKSVCFFGNGLDKCRPLLIPLRNASFVEEVKPFARFMPQLAFAKYRDGKFEDVATFEPYYLKEFLIKPVKKK
jgi:tRNA threonylcarbamoyladenosine biosynthesis protein TsaB